MPTTAAVVVIGNEILSGRTQDANLPYLGRRLAELGVTLAEARIIPDIQSVIVSTVNACRAAHDTVFITGGIGPTHDDITTHSIARAFGVTVQRHTEAVARLQAAYASTQINDARLKMAEIPAGAVLLDNPISGAPGYRIENVYVLAGVPRIMQAMFESFCHQLEGGAPILSRTLSTPLRESQIAADLERIQARYKDTDIGSYPFYRLGRFGVEVVVRGTDVASLEEVYREISALVQVERPDSA